MAQTLEEFLVSVRYVVDQPSQQHFFDGLKRAATSLGGVTAELTGLSVGLLKLSESLAKHGDDLYWMSRRLDTSIGSIEAVSYAMAGFGVSTEQARSAMERFGYWQRSMGPAATAYMRALGITAKDTGLQLEEAGKRLIALRPGSIEYAVELQRLQMMGVDERTALAAGRAAPYTQANERLQAQVWGLSTAGSRGDVRSRLATQTQAYGVASNQVIQQFNRMGLFFEALTQKFALGLFRAIGPDLDKLNALLLQLQPHFERLLNLIIAYAPQMMGFLQGFIKATATFVDLVVEAIDWIGKLPPAIKEAAEGMGAMKLGMDLLASPLGRFILLFTTFMLLLDDYQQWQKNQRHEGPFIKTALDWGGFDAIVKPLQQVAKEIDDWAEKTLGVKDAMEWLVGGLFAAKLLGLTRNIGAVVRVTKDLAAAFGLVAEKQKAVAASAPGGVGGGGGGPGPSYAWGLLGKGIGFGLLALDAWWTAKQKEAEGTLLKGYDPHGKTLSPLGSAIVGYIIGLGKMFRTDNSSGPAQPKPQDDTTAPVTKTDKETKGILGKIMEWGQEAAEGIGKLVDLQQAAQDASEGLTMGVTPEEAVRAGGVAQAGSALTGGGPMTTQQAMDAADLRDDIAKRLNIPPEQAAQIVSAMKFESGLRSDIRYGSGAYDLGGTDAVGLAQWTGTRHAALEAFARAHNLDPKTREAQLQFMAYELSTPQFAGWRAALASGNWGGFYEATSGNVRGADPWGHGRWTEQISKLPPAAQRHASAAGGVGGKQLAINNNTQIAIHTPDSYLAGQKVAAEMTRIYDFQTRHGASILG